MLRAPPLSKIWIIARHVDSRQPASLYVGASVLHAGSVLCVELLVTLPWLLLCHGQCTNRASAYVVFMSDRIFANCCRVSLKPSAWLGPTLESKKMSERATPEFCMPIPTSTWSW